MAHKIRVVYSAVGSPLLRSDVCVGQLTWLAVGKGGRERSWVWIDASFTTFVALRQAYKGGSKVSKSLPYEHLTV